MTKEEILRKQSIENGYIDEVDAICVNGAIDTALEAMQEYADQEKANMYSEEEVIKAILLAREQYKSFVTGTETFRYNTEEIILSLK